MEFCQSEKVGTLLAETNNLATTRGHTALPFVAKSPTGIPIPIGLCKSVHKCSHYTESVQYRILICEHDGEAEAEDL